MMRAICVHPERFCDPPLCPCYCRCCNTTGTILVSTTPSMLAPNPALLTVGRRMMTANSVSTTAISVSGARLAR